MPRAAPADRDQELTKAAKQADNATTFRHRCRRPTGRVAPSWIECPAIAEQAIAPLAKGSNAVPKTGPVPAMREDPIGAANPTLRGLRLRGQRRVTCPLAACPKTGRRQMNRRRVVRRAERPRADPRRATCRESVRRAIDPAVICRRGALPSWTRRPLVCPRGQDPRPTRRVSSHRAAVGRASKFPRRIVRVRMIARGSKTGRSRARSA
jgi:hypothetical protein